jgi:hypothetical protein
MPNLNELLHKELERGVMLDALILFNLEWMTLRDLWVQLAGQGFFPDDRDKLFHLNLLEQGGYIERKSLRSGRADFELQMVRGTVKAVDLKDGRIPADEKIKF